MTSHREVTPYLVDLPTISSRRGTLRIYQMRTQMGVAQDP